MLPDEVKLKLQNIIQGVIIEAKEDSCATIRNNLCASFSTSKEVKRNFESQLVVKKEQAGFLSSFAASHNLWVSNEPRENSFLAAGGEARVYWDPDGKHVLKINDAGYYATWLDFFNSLVLHNIFFPGTAYEFIGFVEKDDTLNVMVRQPFIEANTQVNLIDVENFLDSNGFHHMKRYDYFNKEFGIILEDIHDENVLMSSGTLFFIDTVFYIATPDYH